MAANGFSMAELLIVIALIAVMVTGVGVAFRGGDSSSALASAQSTIGALFTSAQIQATTSGKNVYIMLDTNRNSEGFLRRFVIFRENQPSSNAALEYRVIGKSISLPSGVYVSPAPEMGVSIAQAEVPNIDFIWLAANDPIRKETSGGKIAAGGVAGFGIQSAMLPTEYRSNPTTTTGWYGWKLSPTGRIVDSSNIINQIVLVTGARLPNGTIKVDAEDAYQTRGVKISYYGQVSMIDFYDLFD